MINLIGLNFVNINTSHCDLNYKYLFIRGERIFIKGNDNPNLRKSILKTRKKGNWINYFFYFLIRKYFKKTCDIKEQFFINFKLIHHSDPKNKSKNI